jgi:hypothetical protein
MSLVPDIVLVFKLNGVRKELHYRKISFSAWSELKAQLGFTPLTLGSAMALVDQEALGAIIWLERKQRERNLRWSEVRRDIENNDYELDYVGTIIDGVGEFDEEDEPAPEVEADPTIAAS